MTFMNKSSLYNFAYNCVVLYSTFDKALKQYTIELSNIPDFVQHEFAALIMSLDDARAHEATGPDNALYEKTMLPALLNYLKNTTDKDEEIEFNRIWREGVTHYQLPYIQELLDDAIAEYNQNENLSYKEDYAVSRGNIRRDHLWW